MGIQVGAFSGEKPGVFASRNAASGITAVVITLLAMRKTLMMSAAVSSSLRVLRTRPFGSSCVSPPWI